MFKNLESFIEFLAQKGQLIKISEEVDPDLEIAAIQQLCFSLAGPAILFEKIKGTRFKAVTNLFSTAERQEFCMGNSLISCKELIKIKQNPQYLFFALTQSPLRLIKSIWSSRPQKKRVNYKHLFDEIEISDLPQIKNWPLDGGPFLTLPQVLTLNPKNSNINYSNLGMYRIQLMGNEYIKNKEIGLHYQLHRGIGIHHSLANTLNKPLKVSIFLGGPPLHSLAAVLPLPENISELRIAGVMSRKRFAYTLWRDYVISLDADFVILGEISSNNKPEGPFGDHLGYYSLKHPFPVLKVEKVLCKKNNPIFPFTVVGRPPQEDTAFGNWVHQLTAEALLNEFPGLIQLKAVDEAGVHPLTLAIGKERYTPYLEDKNPAEIINLGLRILGSGQLSLTKFLFICVEPVISINIEPYIDFFTYILERVHWERDLHFITNTTIDTLDYSSGLLNQGSKLLITIGTEKIREIKWVELPKFSPLELIIESHQISPGILILVILPFINDEIRQSELSKIANILKENELFNSFKTNFPLIILTDKANPINNFSDFLWICFTRSNPATDIFGVKSFIINKHWGCQGSLIIDARLKPYIPPILDYPIAIKEKAKKILKKYWNF